MVALNWRFIGPTRGGRVAAVSGDPTDPATFYFGSTGGGVWKTTNAGQTWRNVSDGYFARASVGAIAVAPSNANVIYTGMGEATLRNNISHGDGVYKSTDAGQTWTHLGLEQTRNIGKVRVDPNDENLVYVAAFGHAHGPNPERGVYRTKDGGQSWELVLTCGNQAGAVDLSLDPNQPQILFTAFWEAERGPHFIKSGGPGSGIWRSTDGGDSWEDLSEKPGMPTGIKGKIGVSVSPAQAGRIWAVIEHDDGGVFRSDDGGEHWTRVNADGPLRQRAWYFTHIQADSQNPDSVWVMNLDCWRSMDGGETFEFVSVPHEDSHDLWFDPQNNRRMILGCDGGGTISLNAGEDWSSVYNQPTAELYKVAVDRLVNYRVYGSQQDNSSISVPSRSDHEAITTTEWDIAAGGEAGWLAVHPQNPDVSYGGIVGTALTRYDRATGQVRDISVWPEATSGKDARDTRYRFNWTAPLVISHHDPDVLIAAGNRVFRSTTDGASWDVISPDLTRADPETLMSFDMTTTGERSGGETYATIYALAESPLQAGIIWTGSDDGRVHVTRDNGETWVDVTPDSLPDWTHVIPLVPGAQVPATAFIAATRYRLDDFRPLLYRTTDYGQTWECINGNLPGDALTRTIREDPTTPGVLYIGTETGAYVSLDDGTTWQRLGRKLPIVPVHDLIVNGTDLVAGTHGRGFWILDDVTPLHELRKGVQATEPHLFRPRDTYRFPQIPRLNISPNYPKYLVAAGMIVTYDDAFENFLDAGHNPPNGVIVRYALPEPPAGEVKLTFLDADDQEIVSFDSSGLSTNAGINTFVWDLSYPPPALLAELTGQDVSRIDSLPPRALPNRAYRVRLEVGEYVATQSFAILSDPRHPVETDDLQAQFTLLAAIRERVAQTQEMIAAITSLRDHLSNHQGERTVELLNQLAQIEDELIQVRVRPGTIWDTMKWPMKLIDELLKLSGVVGTGDYRPTSQSVELFDEIERQLDQQADALSTAVAQIEQLNEAL